MNDHTTEWNKRQDIQFCVRNLTMGVQQYFLFDLYVHLKKEHGMIRQGSNYIDIKIDKW